MNYIEQIEPILDVLWYAIELVELVLHSLTTSHYSLSLVSGLALAKTLFFRMEL